MLKKIISLSLVLLMAACSTNKNDSNYLLNDKSKKFDQLQDDILKNGTKQQQTFAPIPGDVNNARVGDRVFFELNSAILTDESQQVLDRQVAWLKDNNKAKITIEGHTDERGTREYNLALGDRRANAVKDYLMSSGIKRSRITTVSYGKERPMFSQKTGYVSLAQNRRAVTTIKNR